jgi:hypothetical protein
LEIGDWGLEIGDWRLEIGDRRFQISDFRFQVGIHFENESLARVVAGCPMLNLIPRSGSVPSSPLRASLLFTNATPARKTPSVVRNLLHP